MPEFFPDVPKIQYGGPKSKNPLEFKHYHPDEFVDRKTMRDHLRFSVVYWHTFCNPLADQFGVGTAVRPWDDGTNSVANAQRKASVAFEFFEKLGVPFYAFHDRDIAPEGKNLKESHANLDEVVKVLKDEQARTGVKLLWGTANLFTNPRYHARSGDQPQFRRLRLRRRPGQEGDGNHPSSSAEPATRSGVAAKAIRPCSTPT